MFSAATMAKKTKFPQACLNIKRFIYSNLGMFMNLACICQAISLGFVYAFKLPTSLLPAVIHLFSKL
jgi:hypothetical protein